MVHACAYLVSTIVVVGSAQATPTCNNFISTNFGLSGYTGQTWKRGGASPDVSIVDEWIYETPLPAPGSKLNIMAHCTNPPLLDGMNAPWQIWTATYTGNGISFPSGICKSKDSADGFWAYTCSEGASEPKDCYQAKNGNWDSWSYWKDGTWYVASPQFKCQDPTTTCTQCLTSEIKAELKSCGEDGVGVATDVMKGALTNAFSAFLDSQSIDDAMGVAGKTISAATTDAAKTQCVACFDKVVGKLAESSCSQCSGGTWALWLASNAFDSAVDQQAQCGASEVDGASFAHPPLLAMMSCVMALVLK
eukprot:TRINITY_DN1960_c0_g1_i4.p1 TRINITY_DN1960_c0_g1~~TRINITY_DN1960_c0_g1_i4.p1  ORF type:complete len:338 (+),score=50.76 TRINITY_DN1960_c0_g1_i4:99-1016(+)